RLYKVTGDEKYLEACRETFPSFLRPRGVQAPFTVELDPLGYCWIEEYPRSVPNQVLNGFIYSLYGVYEYYMLTKDPTVLKVTQAALTTLREYAADFRVPGEISYYCLSHRSQIASYHTRHIKLVGDLYRMTWDSYFKYLSNALKRDHA
ncbi:MAG: D-glucuronyl C5-epimerase family protein, partial [Gemmatimonadota bacterium]